MSPPNHQRRPGPHPTQKPKPRPTQKPGPRKNKKPRHLTSVTAPMKTAVKSAVKTPGLLTTDRLHPCLHKRLHQSATNVQKHGPGTRDKRIGASARNAQRTP